MREAPGANKMGWHHSITYNDVKASSNWRGNHEAPPMQKLRGEEKRRKRTPEIGSTIGCGIQQDESDEHQALS
jgi:hypothetical protein